MLFKTTGRAQHVVVCPLELKFTYLQTDIERRVKEDERTLNVVAESHGDSFLLNAITQDETGKRLLGHPTGMIGGRLQAGGLFLFEARRAALRRHDLSTASRG
ncbi:hypothetical protein CEXT_506821 [Caerostris extrusa]|uniref:Uncharacterized protein n=1 Tax=Caerostris extrusa TaxID=172846 RepID=A0AAV4TIT3_CAEEX|nr:hypothetical protein CEXT_506821 [Caerostris extrusa]